MKTKSSKSNGKSASGGSFRVGRPSSKGIVHGAAGRHLSEVQHYKNMGYKDKDIIVNEDDLT